MWHGDGMGWWMVWGGLMMIPFRGAIITLVVWTVQTLPHASRQAWVPNRLAAPLQRFDAY
jgi:hypothetical protein